jgi:hypothetical protein
MAWSKAIDFMQFHGVFLGSQHASWSKQHNGKISKFIPTATETTPPLY